MNLLLLLLLLLHIHFSQINLMITQLGLMTQ